MASYIADFYSGCKRISERVAVMVDGSLLRGENWHQQLLRQVADRGENNRPPLWSGSLLLELDEYRKFRYLSRHIYNIQLKLDRVLLLAANILIIMPKIQQAIQEFNQWLNEQVAS